MHLVHDVIGFKTTGMVRKEDKVPCHDTRAAGFIATMGRRALNHGWYYFALL
jgi:hypothetical protein